MLDAVVIGEMVPGPVFTASTFIGYILGGLVLAGAFPGLVVSQLRAS